MILNRRTIKKDCGRSLAQIIGSEVTDLTASEMSFFAALSWRGTVICGDEQLQLHRLAHSPNFWSTSGIGLCCI